MSYNNDFRQQFAGTNNLALVSIVSGVLGVLVGWCTFAIPSIVAIVTGHMALSQIKRTGEEGRNLALIGLILGYLSLAVIILLTVLSLVAGVASFGPSSEPFNGEDFGDDD